MKIVKSLGVFAVVWALIACGGSKTENTNTEDSTEALDAAFEVFDEAASQTEQVLNDVATQTGEMLKEASDDISNGSYRDGDESGNSEDWDALLDSYEEYVDSYISLLEKASDGDMSALSEYPRYLSEAQDMGEKLEKVTSELTPSQLSRFNRITQQMLRVVQKMD